MKGRGGVGCRSNSSVTEAWWGWGLQKKLYRLGLQSSVRGTASKEGGSIGALVQTKKGQD